LISAIVLAAGAGTRYGGTKQLAELRGKPLAQHAIDAATEAGVDEVIVVVGHDADRVRGAVTLPSHGRIVVNHAHATGMASSLAAGLAATGLDSEAATVLLADQPGITAGHVRSLVEAYEARRSPIVRLRFRNGPGPALLARDTWAEASSLERDMGARELMDRHPEWVEEVDVGGEAPADVDERSDLERA
jgi:molybdenum cofactor cytidylyltransferase